MIQFLKLQNMSLIFLKKRFKEVAYLNPIISITLEDELAKIKEVYHFEGGIKQFVADLNKETALCEVMHFSDKVDGVEVDIACYDVQRYIH